MEGLFQLKKNKIVSANQDFADLLQFPLEDLIGSFLHDRMEGVDHFYLVNVLNRLRMLEMKDFQGEFEFKNGNSQFQYFHLRLNTVVDENKEVGILGSLKLSEKNSDEIENFLKIERRYDGLLYNTLDGVYIYDYINEKIVDINRAGLDIMKYKHKEDLIGLSRFDFIPRFSPVFPGLDILKYTDAHVENVKKGLSFSTKGIFICQDKSHVLVKAKVIPTFNKHGEGFVIFQDVTHIVHARNALKESEKRYRYIFENSHEGIVYLNLKLGKITICNENALEIFGAKSLTELQRIRFEDFYVPTEVQQGNRAGFMELIQRTVKENRTEIEFWLRKKSKELRRIRAVLVSDTIDKEQPRLVIFLRDITDLHKTQEALKDKNKELQKYITSNLELENFAYFASHDLQTPLRSIISFTQLLKHSLSDTLDKDQEDYMDFIVSSGKNMKKLVDDLLAYSRVNTTKLNRQQVKLDEIFSDLTNHLKADMEMSNAQISFSNLPKKVFADTIKITQVFQNLISNAIKFRAKEITPHIKISAIEKPDHFEFFVKDNGIGIQPEFQDKIFGMFKRLHTSDVYEGTGIGLAIVKKIVEQHDGTITLASEFGKGTTFSFTISKE